MACDSIQYLLDIIHPSFWIPTKSAACALSFSHRDTHVPLLALDILFVCHRYPCPLKPKQLYSQTHHQTHCYPCILMPLWPANMRLRPLIRHHLPCDHTHTILQHLSSHWLYHLCCRPGHARSGGSLALDMDSLQMAAAEANSNGKQDSPRTIMIKANLKKVSLKKFTSMQWHLDLSRPDARGDHLTVKQAAFCISSGALAACQQHVCLLPVQAHMLLSTSNLDNLLQG